MTMNSQDKRRAERVVDDWIKEHPIEPDVSNIPIPDDLKQALEILEKAENNVEELKKKHNLIVTSAGYAGYNQILVGTHAGYGICVSKEGQHVKEAEKKVREIKNARSMKLQLLTRDILTGRIDFEDVYTRLDQIGAETEKELARLSGKAEAKAKA